MDFDKYGGFKPWKNFPKKHWSFRQGSGPSSPWICTLTRVPTAVAGCVTPSSWSCKTSPSPGRKPAASSKYPAVANSPVFFNWNNAQWMWMKHIFEIETTFVCHGSLMGVRTISIFFMEISLVLWMLVTYNIIILFSVLENSSCLDG